MQLCKALVSQRAFSDEQRFLLGIPDEDTGMQQRYKRDSFTGINLASYSVEQRMYVPLFADAVARSRFEVWGQFDSSSSFDRHREGSRRLGRE